MAREKVVVDIEANVNDLLEKLNIAKRRLASWQNGLKDADIKLNANSSVKDLQKALENASTKATADLNRKLTNVAKDIKIGVDKYEFADDKMLAMLADELEWTKEVLTPEKIEQAKINLVDIALKQPPAKKFNPFDLMAPQFRNYPKDKVEWGGVIHDLSDKRLNPVLYDKRLYTPESKISNIQEALEIKGVVSITM